MEYRKLILAGDSEDSFEKNGQSVYGRNIRDLLDRSEIPYTKISVMMPEMSVKYMKWCLFELPKLIIRMRRLDPNSVVHLTWEYYGFLMPFIKGKKIVTVHHIMSEKDHAKKLWYRVWKAFTKMAILRSDLIIAISPQTRKEIIDMLDVPEENIRVIMNRPSDAFTTLDSIEREKMIGFVGTLTKRKNISALLRSFKKLSEMQGMSDVKLKICGKGQEHSSLQDMVRSLGIADRTEFVEDISADDLLMFYNKMTVLANPSLHEGFGNVTLEAQRCSTPVVFFRHAGIPPEVTRFAIGCEDEDEFTDVMYRLLTDNEYWSVISKEGKTYSDNFGGNYSEEMLNLYRDHL